MTQQAAVRVGAQRRPTIPEYVVSPQSLAVENTAAWLPDRTRSVLLVHDMQRYFLDFFEASQRERIIGSVSMLIEAARACEVPVAYTAQPGSMTPGQRGLIADFWGAGMQADGLHRDVVPGCEPRDGDIIETKWRYSAFHNNDLAASISDSGRDQIVISGVYASIGCLASAVDAFSRDLETFFVADAMGDFNRADHEFAASYAARRCAVVMGHRDVAAHWLT